MKKIKLGILGTSEIAFRRFLPAIKKSSSIEYIGVASRDISKTSSFIENYGGKGFDGYDALINSDEINALYIPLPPALHFEWAKKALEAGKHVFLEKPFTMTKEQTDILIKTAKEKSLAVHENYMFKYHNQIEYINNILAKEEIGEVRLIRIDFGFPFRGSEDFRYNKEIGGGALLDCGGYTIKLASHLLGDTARVISSTLNYLEEFNVDIYGSGTLINKEGMAAQISFGMDNNYRCSLEVWGSKGNIYTNRIFSAPDGYEPLMIIKKGNDESIIKLEKDDSFLKSINVFEQCIYNDEDRVKNYREIQRQAILLKEFIKER